MDTKKLKIAYSIVERNGRTYWNRIGIGFVNSDSSLNLKLDSLPVSGELQIRDYSPREEDGGRGQKRAMNRGLSEAA